MKTIPPPVCLRTCPRKLLLVSSSLFLFLLGASTCVHGQVCNDLSLVSINQNCEIEITPDMVLEGTPGDSTYIVHLTTLSGAPIGTVLTAAHLGDTVRATVTDTTTGNSCWGLIVASDHLAPVLVCADIVLPCALPSISPDFLGSSLGISTANPTVTENCGNYTLSYLDSWFDLGCADIQDRSAYIQRVWTAIDASGNQSVCTQLLHLQRIHAADVLFPADTTVGCANPITDPVFTGQPYFQAFGSVFSLYSKTTACELNIGYQDQNFPLCGGVYAILRTWTVLDDCLPSGPGNPRFHIQTITVQDKAGPVFQCPKDTVVSTDPFQCNRTLNLPDVVLYDVCSGIAGIEAKWTVGGGQTYSTSGYLSDFPTNNPWHPDTLGVLDFAPNLPAGEVIPFTYTATDQCGNTTTCSFRVTVSDGIPPFPVCDEYTQVALGMTGESLVFAGTFDDGSIDNCASVRFKARRVEPSACQSNDFFFDQVKFCCADVGKTITVILRVYDEQPDTGAVSLIANEANAGDCEIQVLVEDKLKPLCLPPAHAVITCQVFDPTLQSHGTPLYADNCCLDTTYELTPNYTLFDTICNRGTITRTFRAYDCQGLSSQCTQRLIVQYQQQYAIKFPDDVIVNDCDSTGVYSPEPQIYGAVCEGIGISYNDVVNSAGLLSCYWIERSWRVINWCQYNPNLPLVEVPNPNPALNPLDIQNIPGPVVAPVGYYPPPTQRRITADDPMPTDFSTFWAAEANGYSYRQIIIVRDKEPPKFRGCPNLNGPVEMCDHTTNDPNFWNAPYWKNPHVPGSTDLCEGLSDLAATANDVCAKGNLNIHYVLHLDLDGDGVQETVINSNNPPPAGMVLFGNAMTPNYSGGVLRQYDQRPVPADEKYRFTILKGGFANITGYLRWVSAKEPNKYVVPQLPHGNHRIQWYANDGCGNDALCEYIIRVRDCRAPELICLNGLSTDMPVDQTTTLYAQDFLWYASDNCSPISEVLIGLRRSGSGLGFPFQPDGKPQQSVRFECADLGPQFVELWAMDHAGNMNTCETYVVVQDNFAVCSNTAGTVAGILQTDANEGLEDATIELTGSHPSLPAISFFAVSDQSGAYQLPAALPLGANLTITPVKDNDPLNGVSTFDLSLINKHILGFGPLDTPFKLIAADINNSRSITIQDVVELRKLILGINTDFPQNTSWRFVDVDYVFPNPANPFQEIFPETRQIADLQTSRLQENFTAIKIGDVSGNALASSLLKTDIRTAGTAFFDVERTDGHSDTNVRAGQEFDVSVRATDTLLGFQFTLAHPGLEVVYIVPGAGMSNDNFAVFPSEAAVTLSWDGRDKPFFVMRFRARKTGRFEQMLQVSSRITKAEAYRNNGGIQRQEIALRLGGSAASVVRGQVFELYPNEPNPWSNHTRIRFYLPDAAEVVFTVFDQTGQAMFSQTGGFEAGFQSIELDAAALPGAAGALYYRLETPTESAVGKMVRW
jgi:hypothetical protein